MIKNDEMVTKIRFLAAGILTCSGITDNNHPHKDWENQEKRTAHNKWAAQLIMDIAKGLYSGREILNPPAGVKFVTKEEYDSKRENPAPEA